ncbi:MAG: MarR family transcriptional regulator [Chloroflexi bacterium]|nr:MarR family transcriptional regulator [Chloroflexota bacterium]
MQTYKTVFHALQAANAAQWLHLELTMAQLKALMALSKGDGETVGSMADALEIGLSASSQLTERLVQHGLVERRDDPSDRRRALVHLSPAGEQLVTRLRQGNEERLRDWLARLEEADLQALVQGLRALAAVASARREAVRP